LAAFSSAVSGTPATAGDAEREAGIAGDAGAVGGGLTTGSDAFAASTGCSATGVGACAPHGCSTGAGGVGGLDDRGGLVPTAGEGKLAGALEVVGLGSLAAHGLDAGGGGACIGAGLTGGGAG